MRLGALKVTATPDAREQVRLAVVALAVEVDTLAARLEEEADLLVDVDELEAVLREAAVLRVRAAEVLAIESQVHAEAEAALQERLAAFTSLQQEATQLRSRATGAGRPLGARRRTRRPACAGWFRDL